MIVLDGQAAPRDNVVSSKGDVLADEREAYRLASIDLLRGLQAACDLFIAALPPPTAERGGQADAVQAAMVQAVDEYNRADAALRATLAGYGALLDVQGVA